MTQEEYKIEISQTNSSSEETSAISLISYEIENANYHKLSNDKIKDQIKDLTKNNKFPKNLEYVSSYTDPKSGTTASAFKNTDTGKVIVGMTGTNLQKDAFESELNYLKKDFNHFIKTGKKPKSDAITTAKRESNLKEIIYTLQDVGADANIALRSVTHEDRHFENTQEYIQNLKKNYEIDTITGHSLGGRDAMILGMSNNIDNIITYNTAPISVIQTRLLNPPLLLTLSMTAFNDVKTDNMINNYDGNITHFISNEDELNGVVNQFIHVLPGKRIIIPNGKNHSMDGFLGKYEQSIITNKLKKPNKFESTMKKTFKYNQSVTKDRLKKIDDIKSAMVMQNGGGALSSSQQKLLEYVTALAIVKGLSQQISEDIEQIKNMYDEMKELFQVNWQDALESGHTIGKNLSSQEVLNALNVGDVYEDKMVTTPIDKINEKVKKLNATATQYREFITKAEDSIDEIINNDQMLANQIGGLL
ncbi:hypothetical protein NQ016_08545 [Staphylococcus hyicus]|uniref:hypothetical protein n=1 Tax=Staphylococcus hyicus TaxID=1284 RepID=UPI00211C4A69|nr:hypothetical protein [Staphylococcus hyicus]MCQ9291541.1 hypothetical protein [Staphylococcus hyicus]MCQ9306782.1 hypothetical protein [Staphylococcus hyicus]MCQ9309579.1 hypothetical protein [Staphylococcus hyicus]MCQ9311616.1 hypothetical protein [Staphylococcus hyicus]